MKIKCEVIRDLLPLYAENVASRESCDLIEEHLKECAECREYCRMMKEDVHEAEEMDFAGEIEPLRKVKRRMFLNKIMAVMVAILLAACAAWFIYSQDLGEYIGSLEENVTYELPEGYVCAKAEGDKDHRVYTRQSENRIETLDIWYTGLDEDYDFGAEKTIRLDDSTDVNISLSNWDNDYHNYADFQIVHGREYYQISYQCKETDKVNYYASCSKQQQAEVLDIIKTFDFHKPEDEDVGNIFVRLHKNFGAGLYLTLIPLILILVALPIAIALSELMESGKTENVVNSRKLHDSMNRERRGKGESELPAINNMGGASTNNLARRDHSWNSVPDFFMKLIKRKR